MQTHTILRRLSFSSLVSYIFALLLQRFKWELRMFGFSLLETACWKFRLVRLIKGLNWINWKPTKAHVITFFSMQLSHTQRKIFELKVIWKARIFPCLTNWSIFFYHRQCKLILFALLPCRDGRLDFASLINPKLVQFVTRSVSTIVET